MLTLFALQDYIVAIHCFAGLYITDIHYFCGTIFADVDGFLGLHYFAGLH
jgi:hypothetical protein